MNDYESQCTFLIYRNVMIFNNNNSYLSTIVE